MNWALPHWALLGLATFAGAVVSTLVTSIQAGGLPTTSQQWIGILVTALGAGIAAIVGLYQTTPGHVSIPVESATPRTVAAIKSLPPQSEDTIIRKFNLPPSLPPPMFPPDPAPRAPDTRGGYGPIPTKDEKRLP